MSIQSLSALCGLLLVAGCAGSASLDVPEQTAAPVEVRVEASPDVAGTPVGSAMLVAVNRVRAAGATCGDVWHPPVRPLSWDHRLERAAQGHARDMVRHAHFEHRGTDGRDPGERARHAGYHWWAVAENIARHQSTVDQVMRDWLASPDHCRQLLSPKYVELGAAESGGYWSQMFAVSRG